VDFIVISFLIIYYQVIFLRDVTIPQDPYDNLLMYTSWCGDKLAKILDRMSDIWSSICEIYEPPYQSSIQRRIKKDAFISTVSLWFIGVIAGA